MKQGIRPFGIFLFLIAVLVLLTVISIIFPQNGIHLGKDFYLYFPEPGGIFRSDTPEYADITDLLDSWTDETDEHAVLHVSEDTLAEGIPLEPVIDSLNEYNNVAPAASEQELRKLVFPLEFPDDSDTVMYSFFRHLDKTGDRGNLLRILHYGDSQIENNRISSTLRNRFQARFGGSGIGMFPVVSPVPHSASIQVLTAGRWERYTPLERGNNRPSHNRYGLLMSFSSISGTDEVSDINGSFTIRPTTYGNYRSRTMNQLGIFFGNTAKPILLELLRAGETLEAELFFPSDSLRWIKWTLPEKSDEYTVRIQGEGSPEIYSVLLDDTSGVAVDNIAMRGSGGLEFSGTNAGLLRKMMDELNVRLVLLQFGVNVVPNIVDDYSYYENALLRQLQFLQSLSPDICIIVIGVSDMSRRLPGGQFESYPNIRLIRDAQRNAAFRAGFPFWDLFEAMGGQNSMPSWVMAEPPLGQNDYTHFTFRGSALVGDLLYKAIAGEYDKYLDLK
jgi:hypothetical protein